MMTKQKIKQAGHCLDIMFIRKAPRDLWSCRDSVFCYLVNPYQDGLPTLSIFLLVKLKTLVFYCVCFPSGILGI